MEEGEDIVPLAQKHHAEPEDDDDVPLAKKARTNSSRHGKFFTPCESDLADVELILEGGRIKVSKAVLAAASPVFNSMFTGDFKEKNAKEVELPGKNFDNFVVFVRCIYPSEYVKISDKILRQILPLAKEYCADALLNECEVWLLEALEKKIASLKTKFARSLKNPDLGRHWQKDCDLYMKTYWYGLEYGMGKVAEAAKFALEKFQTSRLYKSKYYSELSDRQRCELLEFKIEKLEELPSFEDLEMI